MVQAKKRPKSIWLSLIGGVIGLPTGLILSGFFPEGSAMRVLAGLGGIAAPPVALLAYSNKKWSEYVEYMLEQYEATKEQLRQNPSSSQATEAMLNAGRAYYSCMREQGIPAIHDEQKIDNDIKAIVGVYMLEQREATKGENRQDVEGEEDIPTIHDKQVINQDYGMNDLVKITDGALSVSFNSVVEAKLAIKQLRLKKKELNLLKKEITQEQQKVRAKYTNVVRKQGSKYRGGGGMGKLIRDFQTLGRDLQRIHLAQELEPLEKRKHEIDSIINAIEQAMLQVESYIIKNS